MKYKTLSYVGSASELLTSLQDEDNVFIQMEQYLQDHGSSFMKVYWMNHDGDPFMFWYDTTDYMGKTQQVELPAIYNEVAHD